MGLILREVEVDGAIVDVSLHAGMIVAIAPNLQPGPADQVIDGERGALIPGLHDHHVHVLALARASTSIAVDPGETPTSAAFISALTAASSRGAVRAIGYHERVHGPLDRSVLDSIIRDVPVRVQHRTGGLWILNSLAIDAAGLEQRADARVERDKAGRATGRIWRGDDLVRIEGDVPTVETVGAELVRCGVTAITDATVTNDAATVARLRELPVRVRVMGPLDLDVESTSWLELGEVKLILDDENLPDVDTSVALVRAAHEVGRGVAVHCVTLVQIRFALEIVSLAGSASDRIEHASVAPPDVVDDVRRLGLTVATQPAFLSRRGDEYLSDVDSRDLPFLYPIGSLLAAGVPTRGSSDAPYGSADPWVAMRAAVFRRSESGVIVGATERIGPRDALGLFGGTDVIRVGTRADLVLLAVPLATALEQLVRDNVKLTIIGGKVAYLAT